MKRFIIIVGTLLCLSNALAEGAKYLIITHDDFRDAIQPLAQWKNKKGITTTVVDKTTIEEQWGSWDSDAIRDYIAEAYNTWNPRPEYVLLVGSSILLPSWYIGGFSENAYSDDPYADMTGDYRIEFGIGRLPCSTATQCNVMVAKTLAYEQRPFMTDTIWFKKGTGIVRDRGTSSDPVYWENVRYIFGLWLNADYVYIDSFSISGGNSANDVENAITDGRAFIVYRGEAISWWGNPFNININNINNNSKLPIVISGSCQTIQLGPYSQTYYLGNAFLIAGSTQNIKGTAGYFGTTDVGSSYSLSVCRGTVTKGFFRSVFTDNVYKLGDATKRAKFIIDSIQPPGYDTIRYMEWNLLGDPELNLWTAVPKPMLVTYNLYIPTGSQDFSVTVLDSSSQSPIVNALVCVMMPNDQNVYDYGYTDGSGTIIFTINPTQTPDSMWITVTAQNYRPYEGKCDVLYLASENGTFPNQGRHLARTINTQDCFLVYQGIDSIIWQERNEVINTPVLLDQGKYPSIAVTSAGSSWVCYTSDIENAQYLKCRIKRSEEPYDWKEIAKIWSAESLFASSLALAIGKEVTPENMGYVVYATKENGISYIHFSAFDSLQEEPYYTTVLDIGEEDISVLAPSISITPGDLIHIVWQKTEHEGDISRIYYITTLEPITSDDIRHGAEPIWSDIVQISRPDDPCTEPASNPSTEAYGEYVYAAWRGPNEKGNPEFGDIWRRARWLPNDDPTNWDEPRNMSETYDDESNYPVMFTDFATVWQEQVSDTNWDIYGNIGDYTGQLFETPKSSKYPHIDGYWDPAAPIATFYCYTIWTEEIAHPVYEVRFGRYEWTSGKSAFDHPYYVVEIGDSSPSPYCTQRDGYLSYGQYAIDYGNQKLKYKLPYLHPSYYYDLRAIVYQQGQNNWSQNFDIDSALSTTITFEPNRPETIWIRLPQESYKYDTKVKQEIKKILGNRVVIADLRLYQVEEIDTIGSGSGPQSASSALIQKPILYQSYPNPAKARTVIRFSLSVNSKVNLSIYDISGRLVKTLVNQNQTFGIYSISWDGRDNKGRTVAQGVYFCHLKTDDFSDIKRLVLIR
jgi:hypothetical protein